jgi:chloramphenicol-sensitive protein RarD
MSNTAQPSPAIAASLPAVAAIVGACTIWGLSALYFSQLAHVQPSEVLAHRTVWSTVFFVGFCAVTGRLPRVAEIFRSRRQVAILVASALTMSVNWALFIWAVTTGHVVQSALGYYIFPLVMAFFGWAVYRETLRPLQLAAMALAMLATVGLAAGLGAAPWLSLALAVSFACYGLAKRAAVAGPISSVTAEVLLFAPLGIGWLIGVHYAGWSDGTERMTAVFGTSWRDTALLACSGALTGLPMALYTVAAQRLPMATVGLISYLNPSLQFMVAVLVLGETVTVWHMIAFPMIWAALALYSLDAIRRERAARRAQRARRGSIFR